MPAPSLELPRDQVAVLHQLATRLLDGRKPGTPIESLARALLGGFYDACMRSGLDGLLAALAQAHPPLEYTDRNAFVEHATLVPALTARLEDARLDAGGPRNARPGQLADCLLGALGATAVDPPDRTIVLDDGVRLEAAGAVLTAVDAPLAVPAIRDAIVALGRERCEARYRIPFDKIAAQLDERGIKILKQPNVPLDAVQAVQRVLFEARNAVVEKAARAAIDRAQAVIAHADPDAAARIDQPITLRLTPRDVAIARACETSVPKTPTAVAASLFDSLTTLARLAWRAPVRVARTYSPKETFALGELVTHPKFGEGSVTAIRLGGKIDVAFPDTTVTLIHKG
jgi:hypothetical protein